MWQPHAVNARHESRGEVVSGDSTGTTVTANGTQDVKGSWVALGGVSGFAYEALTVCFSNNSIAADFSIDIGFGSAGNEFVVAADLHFAARKLGNEQCVVLYLPLHVPEGAQLRARASLGTGGGGTCAVSLVGHAAGLGGAPGFSRCVALFAPSAGRGIAVDPGGTANTKGSWAQITASCPNDIGAMFGLIGYNGDVARGTSGSMLLDIGIGAGGAEFVLYPNAGLKWSTVTDGPTNCPRIPLFACNVPATTRIAARAQCSDNTAGDRTIDLALYGLVP